MKVFTSQNTQYQYFYLFQARKSTRNTRLKSKSSNTASAKSTVQGRRCIFKKNPPQKTLSHSQPTTKVLESLFYQGSYYQTGDIVSLIDENEATFYAQIRGLIEADGEKSAVITWLLPTTSSPNPNERFDPSTYLIGPEEETPRRLSSMLFVMHAPSNYYHDKTNPYPAPEVLQSDHHLSNYCGFIWTSIQR